MLLLGRRCVVHTSLLPLRRISPYLPSLVDGHCSSGIGGSGGAAAAAASCVRHKTNGGVPRTKRKYEPGANKYQFVDKLRIVATGGKGGDGCISLEGESAIRKRPSGGSGGAGGRVFAVADKTLESLHSSEHHFNGAPGGQGGGAGKKGRRGKDVYLRVPCGTLVSEVMKEDKYDDFHSWAVASSGTPSEGRREAGWTEGMDSAGEGDNERPKAEEVGRDEAEEEWDALVGGGWSDDEGGEDQDSDDEEGQDNDGYTQDETDHEGYTVKLVADLEDHGDSVLLANGGVPGLGNLHVMSRNVGTKLPGQRGESRYYSLELRTIADVGLAGYPNAGKSTLLGCLTNAKPKVALYPFTTLSPVVGQVEYSDTVRLSIADIPGLIEGAHQNRGLGHEFLRHISRTRALIFVVDAAGSEGRNPAQDLRCVRDELRLYDERLAEKPALVVANKMDLPGAEEYMADLRRAAEPMPIIPISALESKGLLDVVVTIRELLEGNDRRRRKAKKLPSTGPEEFSAVLKKTGDDASVAA